MDVYELRTSSKKNPAPETPRPPLVPSERNNAVSTVRRPRTREVSSRYMSPTPGSRRSPSPNITRTSTGQRRCPSPNIMRTSTAASQLVTSRAQSAERKRPSTPQRPTSPSTPVHSAYVDRHLSVRKLSGRLPEGLWPSTMRSLSVSFQADSISIPVGKKEKPARNTTSDRSLRPSSNVAHRQVETSSVKRKLTPERKRSPLRGKGESNQSENSKPVERLPTRLVDQHRWPSRMGGKVSSNGLTKSEDHADKMDKTPAPPGLCMNSAKLMRIPSTDGMVKHLQKSAISAAKVPSFEESGRLGSKPKSIDDSTLWKPLPPVSIERNTTIIPAARSQSLPSTGLWPTCPSKTPRPPSPTKTSRPPSPNKALTSSHISRGISPHRLRPSTPSRTDSPSRIRISNPASQSNSSTSVLSFIADIRKGQKAASYIEDAHQLRLMHNRYLQWRFANAQAEALLYVQRKRAERTLYNVWGSTLESRESVSRKRIDLQQLNLELKLNSIVNEQMPYLNDWALLERNHVSSLSGAAEDLEANTLRLPVTGGARINIDSLEAAIGSAVDVMKAMGSSICPLLSRVEEANHLVSNLAVLAARERIMLDECESLLSRTAALQVEEQSLRIHLIQMKQTLENDQHQPTLEIKTPP